MNIKDAFVHPDDFAREYRASVTGLQPKPLHQEGCGAHDDYQCDCKARKSVRTIVEDLLLPLIEDDSERAAKANLACDLIFRRADNDKP